MGSILPLHPVDRDHESTHATVSLASAGVVTRHAAEALLFQEGDAAEACYRVLSGTVRLYRLLQDGRRHIVGFAAAGRFFAWDDEARYSFAAETVSEAVIVRYPRAQLDALVVARPELAWRLLALARKELGAARAHALMLGRKTATERLATFLLGRAAEEPRDETGTSHIELPMGRADVADHLGLTTETVSRCLSQLRRLGLISLDGQRRCRLLRPAALRALAEGGPSDPEEHMPASAVAQRSAPAFAA